ncbi:hypothetical protein R3P38DRAFT_3339329 [Favolaschia claudopus]|uniref:Uncharacterized protein n=1 Tax=Favolaschia claudopus TaxID=2862362 RepID=A0AAW0EH33_9AGAR
MLPHQTSKAGRALLDPRCEMEGRCRRKRSCVGVWEVRPFRPGGFRASCGKAQAGNAERGNGRTCTPGPPKVKKETKRAAQAEQRKNWETGGGWEKRVDDTSLQLLEWLCPEGQAGIVPAMRSTGLNPQYLHSSPSWDANPVSISLESFKCASEDHNLVLFSCWYLASESYKQPQNCSLLCHWKPFSKWRLNTIACIAALHERFSSNEFQTSRPSPLPSPILTDDTASSALTGTYSLNTCLNKACSLVLALCC